MADSLFTLENAVDAVSGRFVGASCGASVTGVSIDTRTLVGGDLFVALPGEKTDGHAYLKAAFEAGAAGALADVDKWELLPLEIREAGPFILVKDPLGALQELARWYLDRYSSVLKIAVTGRATARQQRKSFWPQFCEIIVRPTRPPGIIIPK